MGTMGKGFEKNGIKKTEAYAQKWIENDIKKEGQL